MTQGGFFVSFLSKLLGLLSGGRSLRRPKGRKGGPTEPPGFPLCPRRWFRKGRPPWNPSMGMGPFD
ncbi:MAG: hypothetical protein DRG31_06795 [Deltaproteobacteria bacterium]|nr:MAG: hypothetical protein DRG31_06795 [Deltaproteobacteria bacterium]